MAARTESVTDLLYAPGEGIFSLVGPMMWENGWSVFPQERTGARRPGKAGGSSILWGRLCDVRATPEEMQLWVTECSQLNVACALGAASGYTFTIDIDCLDPELSASVRDIALRILGNTPFRRIGRAPKLALIYRYPPGAVPHYFSRKFLNGDVPTENGLEVLASGRALTMHGLHHVTGRYFNWPELSPITSSPSAAPEVTPGMLDAFLAEVAALHPFAGNENTGGVRISSEDWADSGGIRVPVTGGNHGYSTDAEGRISDGREQYLTGLVYYVVTGNKTELLRKHAEGEAVLRVFMGRLCRAVADIFRDNAVVSGKWKTGLERQIQSKVSHLTAKVTESPEDFPAPDTGGRTFTVLPSEVSSGGTGGNDPELEWMRRNPRVPVKGWYEHNENAFPLKENRELITSSVGNGIEDAISAFLDEVHDETAEPGLHILDAPTGGGKTSRTLRRIASDPRTYMLPADGSQRKPFVMLLPTYSNIDELRARASILNLNGSLPDDELRSEAAFLGLIAEDAIGERIAELRRDALDCGRIAQEAGSGPEGFITAVYSGKIRAGCIFPEKVALAMSAGIGASAFCRAIIPSGKGTAEDVCSHYDKCGAIRQRDTALSAHLVFMPHSFLALAIPEELENMKAVIADERVHHLFLHVGELHLSTLKSPRRPPRLTKTEQIEELNPQEILADRNLACNTVISALGKGECPAAALLSMSSSSEVVPRGLLLAENALRVCGDGVRRDGKIAPSTSFEDVRAYCTRPVGYEIREEMQFWRIITERIRNLVFDREFNPATASEEAEKILAQLPEDAPVRERLAAERRVRALRRAGTRAKGKKDARIQLVEDGEGENTIQKIRISWRTFPNWIGLPTMLLDASAAPDIAARIWGIPRERVILHRVTEDFGAALNVKVAGIVSSTYSNSYVVGSAGSGAEERLRNGSRLARIRDAVSAVCAVHASGRVVAGAGMLLREAISESWQPPVNLDWCHYGAMRGLDMFKNHSAAISVGRMELPVRTIDGLTAALTYDDDEPEAPFDIRGDGKDPFDSGSPLRLPSAPRQLRMRNGGTVWVEIPCYPGRWASLIQKQYREEELLQFVGRLRPIYREGIPPIWYALTSVIPEGIIMDDILDIEDMLSGVQGGTSLWNAARRCGGVLHPALMSSVCPDIFPSREEAERLFSAAYASPDSRAWKEWIRGTVVSCGNSEPVMLSPFAENPELMLSKILFMPVVEIATAISRSASRRAPDTVDEKLGSNEVRGSRENHILDMAGVTLLNEGKINARSGIMEVNLNGVKARMSAAEICAVHSIRKTWNKRSGNDNNRLREGDESPLWESRDAG